MALQYVYLLAILNMKYYHREDPGYVNLYISGYQDTKIEYLLPWEDESRKVVLDQSNQRTWEKTIRLSSSQEEIATSKGIRVTSSSFVTIQVSRGKLQLTNTAAYTAVPLNNISKEFILSSQRYSPGGLAGSQSVFTIGAGERGARVGVFDNKTETPSLLFVKTLSSFQMLEIPSGQDDLTGIYVRADRPIVVYSGHQCGNVPVGVHYCEPLFQQVPALPLVGMEYVMGPIMQRNAAGYTARVIVTAPNTDIVLAINSGTVTLKYTNLGHECSLRKIDGGKNSIYKVECNFPLQVGTYLEFHVMPSTSPLVLKCSASCYAYQMNHGGAAPATDVKTDPYMALVPPLGQQIVITKFSTISSFSSNAELNYRNFVSIIAPKNTRLLLDGGVLSTDDAYVTGDYVIYYKEIRHGFHEVRTQNGEMTNLVIQVYGHGPSGKGSFSGQSAYGFPGAYIGPGLHDLGIPIHPMTTSSPLSTTTKSKSTTTWTSTTIYPRSTTSMYINDVSDGGLQFSSGSHTSAITTGILTAITVIVIIVVTCAIIITIVVLVLRNRRRKSNPQQIVYSTNATNPYVNTSNAAVFVEAGTSAKQVSKPVTMAQGPVMASAPKFSDIHDEPSASPPKYEDVYNEIEPAYANEASYRTTKPDGNDLYQEVHPIGGDSTEYEDVSDATASKDNTYEGLGDVKQPEDTYDMLQQ